MLRARLVAVVLMVVLTGCSPTTDAAWSEPQPAAGGTTAYAQSYAVDFPADIRPQVRATCLPSTSAAVENRHRGTTSWRTVDTSAHPRFLVYLSATSAVCGERVSVHLGTAVPGDVVVMAYRIGWYHGSGGRLVWSTRDLHVATTQDPKVALRTVPSPGWPAAATIDVTRQWVPGLYLVAAEADGRLSGAAPLVVRDPVLRPSVVTYSQLTWNAYSKFVGTSLYDGPDGRAASRALEVSLQRPFVAGGLEAVLYEDAPVAELIDRTGIAVDPCVDTDVDAWPSLYRHRADVIIPGHSEYWTSRMFDALTAARNTGSNIADLGANDVYWRARVAYGADGLPASMFVARDAALDPAATHDPTEATIQWRALGRTSASVLGQAYTAVRAKGGEQVLDVPSWLSATPGLTRGATLDQAAWGEVDGVWPGLLPYPPNLQVVSLGVLRERGHPDKPASITYYSGRTGGGVLDTGSTYWPCLTLDQCPHLASTPSTIRSFWALSRTVLRDFQSIGWGATHPSTATLLQSVASLHHLLPSAAVGTAGEGD